MDHTIDSVMLWAVRNGYDDLVQALLKRGANPLATDADGNSLYDIAGRWMLSGIGDRDRLEQLERTCVEITLFETGLFGQFPPCNIEKVRRAFWELSEARSVNTASTGNPCNKC